MKNKPNHDYYDMPEYLQDHNKTLFDYLQLWSFLGACGAFIACLFVSTLTYTAVFGGTATGILFGIGCYTWDKWRAKRCGKR